VATVRIESIAAGGDGVGRLDGLAVFTPRTAPGELVEVAVRQRGRMARGRLLEVIEASPDRIAPRCRHYDGDRCGGCQLQHLTIEAQRSAKQRIVGDAFRRIARREVETPTIVPSPSTWEYRSRLTLALRWNNSRWIMGLHAFDDVDRVFDLHECPITDPRIVDAWRAVRQASHALPRVRELRGTVRLLGNDLALILEGGDAWPQSREFAAAVPQLAVIRWRPARAPSRVIVDRRSEGTPEESFDQVNQPVAVAARQEIVQRALNTAPRHVVDAYAGLGATARALAEHGVSVTAIEADEAAARFTAGHLPSNSRAVAARVEDAIAEVLPADVVVLNPPRAGVDARVTSAIELHRPPCVLYMSCDPATLARDVSRLPAYRVTSLRAYDMFPQTAHVEVVCELRPEER
jgi:23S rRNA (uracil1939-C5)-methyltransferase